MCHAIFCIYRKRNILGKITIPRIIATIKYILVELEERDREELFRLKRFIQLKTKKTQGEFHICCCCLAMFESEESVRESVCPVCRNATKAKGRQSEMKLNVVPCRSAEIKGKENKKRLEHLMSHIDEVIDLTKQYKMEGIITPSIEKLIKTCNQVKEKIEDYANAPPLCDVCRKALEGTGSRIALSTRASRTGSSKSMTGPPAAPDRPTEEPPCSDSTYNLSTETEEKLGYFEKKFKEIVKVTRLQNEDGSISEEKQVITIRTERRNPRRPDVLDGRNDDSDNFVGSFGETDSGGGGGGGGGCSKGTRGTQGGFDGDGGGSDYYNIGTRETKSEHANRSHQMGEPKLRSCISASHPKATMNRDACTNFDASANISMKPSKVTLPSEPEYNTSPCHALPKITKASSIDSQICCPRKTASVCGSVLQSGVSSLVSIESCKPTLSKTVSAQTCCKEIPVKKPMVDQGTCCLPVCEGEAKCPDNKDNKTKAVSTDALWRDAWTSTTDISMVPSKMPSKKPSFNNKEASCENVHFVENNENKSKPEESRSCCTIKIIAKPPKVCCIDDKEQEKKKDDEEVVLRGSMLDAIKKIFLPPSRSTESCKIEPLKEPEIKNICKSCLSKLNSSVPPQRSTQSSTCKISQARPEEQIEQEIKSCTSCGSISKYSSCDSMSNKSMAVGSASSLQHTCMKSTESAHSQKHICCLSKRSSRGSSDKNTCCAMAQTKSSKTICCSKKKSSSAKGPVADTPRGSVSSIKSSTSCFQKKDATTCTKRSTRFDVRPLRKRHTCEKINLGDCTCRSDSYMLKTRGQNRKPVQRSKSFYEDEYYFFRW